LASLHLRLDHHHYHCFGSHHPHRRPSQIQSLISGLIFELLASHRNACHHHPPPNQSYLLP